MNYQTHGVRDDGYSSERMREILNHVQLLMHPFNHNCLFDPIDVICSSHFLL